MKPMRLRGFHAGILLVWASFWSPLLWGQVHGEAAPAGSSLRDPTVAPMSPAAMDSSAPASGNVAPERFSIMVVDGVPHVIIGTRLYAQGQKLGEARIERISETEVWLREGGQLRKISQFPGIERQSVSTDCAARAPKGPKTSRSSEISIQVNPCASDKP